MIRFIRVETSSPCTLFALFQDFSSVSSPSSPFRSASPLPPRSPSSLLRPSPSPLLLAHQVRSCRLIRMLKLERYVQAFEVFDDAIRDQLDILAVSGFFALIAWVFASSLL